MAGFWRLLFAGIVAWNAVHVSCEEETDAKTEEADKSAGEKVVDGFSETDRAKMTDSSEKHEFQA